MKVTFHTYITKHIPSCRTAIQGYYPIQCTSVCRNKRSVKTSFAHTSTCEVSGSNTKTPKCFHIVGSVIEQYWPSQQNRSNNSRYQVPKPTNDQPNQCHYADTLLGQAMVFCHCFDLFLSVATLVFSSSNFRWFTPGANYSIVSMTHVNTWNTYLATLWLEDTKMFNSVTELRK